VFIPGDRFRITRELHFDPKFATERSDIE